MYIDWTGPKKPVLRDSFKDRGKVRKQTWANLAWMSADELARLEALLKARRQCHFEARYPIDAQIKSMLIAGLPLDKQWRLFQSRPAPRC